MSGRQLQLFFLEEQVEYLLRLGDVEVISDLGFWLLEPGAGQGLGGPGPLDNRHLGLIGRFFLCSVEVRYRSARSFCIKIRVKALIGRYLG